MAKYEVVPGDLDARALGRMMASYPRPVVDACAELLGDVCCGCCYGQEIAEEFIAGAKATEYNEGEKADG